MAPPSKLEVGIIGAGMIARSVHLPVLLDQSDLSVAWITDANEDTSNSVARANGIRALRLPSNLCELPNVDLILLAIPVGVRSGYYEALAPRACGVFVEKPFARTAGEHRAILECFAPHRLACGYLRRQYRASRFLRRCVNEGAFGPLMRISLADGGRSTKSGTDRSFLDDVRLGGGGVLIDLGSHALDLILHMTGASSFEVDDAEIVSDDGIDRQVRGVIRLIVGAREVPVSFSVTWLERQANGIELEFERARLRVGMAPNANIELLSLEGNTILAQIQPELAGATTVYQACHLEWRDFIDSYRRGESGALSAASCLATTSLVEQIYAKGRGQ